MASHAHHFLPRCARWAGMGLLALPAMLGLGIASPAHAGESERIFRDGFEPCCSLGGVVSGLAGDGLILNLQGGGIDEDLPIAASAGSPRLYTFAASLSAGTAYQASIASQPTGQVCTLGNASGVIGNAPVANIDVACSAMPGLIWDQGSWDAADWQ